MQYQANKALELLTKKLNRPPKPRELAEVIQADVRYASRFLRNQFAKDGVGHDDDEPESDVTLLSVPHPSNAPKCVDRSPITLNAFP